MKPIIKTKTFNIRVMLFTIIFLLTAGYNFAQFNTKQLEDKVEKKISSEYLEPFMISADQNGIITVNGQVSTLYDKLKIEELISQVKGVQKINNKIFINTEPTADEVIKDNIELELERNNVILEPEKIKVNVTKGVVSLSGNVSYYREKVMAQSIASWQDGVTDMQSNIVVSTPSVAMSDQNLNEIISDILKNHFSLEHNVKFDVTNGEVDLYGSANSLYAKNHIQEEIQHVLGVKNVINEIQIENNV